MQKHKYNIYPEMQADEYAELLADIKANGYDESQPIYLYEGDILDGWNRQRACNELGVTPKYETFEGSDFEAIMFVIRTNKRRNLNSSQKACIAADADEIIKVIAEQVEAERRQKISERENFGNRYTDKVETGELIPPFLNPEKETNKTRSKVAKMFDTNSRYVSDAIKLKETNPEKFEQVKSGGKTLPEVKKEEKKEELLNKVEEARAKIQEAEQIKMPANFGVIVIDPPWDYSERGGFVSSGYDSESNRGALDYPTMTLKEIGTIELPAAEDCVLFLWTTHKFLNDSFALVKNWGFDYKATIVWDKMKMGIGRTIRLQCEFCLLAIKGNPIILGNSERDIISEARREHSRKPDAFYAMVERMTVGSRIDYFSREYRLNWFSYGAEIGKF